ncbi:MAG: carboxypeptidase regulatory-like domain-containing protein [Cyclobacteriaceae bacterium]|nr:carboxypeptidase regulatory-like domain-containing protein [Cyclobacteriaceae bacterium]
METSLRKKEKMQVVKALKTTVMLLLLSIITSACESSVTREFESTYNLGGYEITLHHNDSHKFVKIQGYVRDKFSNEAIEKASIKIGCYNALTDRNGLYSVQLKSGTDKLFISCNYIGYREIETKSLAIEPGDDLTVNFFLAEDDRPINNCEGRITP